MCKKCNKPSCTKDPCIELEKISCDVGCPDIVDTGCIFHNMDGDSGQLFNLGIVKGSTLKYILKRIDEKLGESINTDFSSFNMHTLNDVNSISTIKEFVEAITLAVKTNKDLQDELGEEIEALEEIVETLGEEINKINSPNLSNSKLNISTTDSLKDVLVKIIAGINNVPVPTELTFTDSTSIKFETGDDEVIAEMIISPQQGNIITNQGDGLYAIPPSVSSILNTIKNNTELYDLFNSLVVFPPLKYDVMATTNQIITYINSIGDSVNVTAKANVLLQLTDVRSIVSTPSTNLVITFKGI